MAIQLKSAKMLWGRAASRCSICCNELIEAPQNEADDESVIGDMAHIIARKETFTRGDYDSLTEEQRDYYSNLILLCKKHHKVIDDQPAHYTVEKLHEIKSAHELWVTTALGTRDAEKENDGQIYAGIIDEWVKRIDLDNWTASGTHIYSASGPTILNERHEELSKISQWILARPWPHRYVDLEDAFFNFKTIMQDFLKVLHHHLERPSEDSDWLVTKNFYKIDEWNPTRYQELYRRFDSHVCLVGNLYTELTRAINRIAFLIRKRLFRGFRLVEGLALVQRDMVNGFTSESYRAEYGTELARDPKPYKGLEHFIEHQYEGAYVLKPEHLSE